jgi:thiosulfate/3-mercaptopyruvate sulfurtransferase
MELDPKPFLLVEPQWLESHLNDRDLRIIDCTVWMTPRPVGPSIVTSGRDHWRQGHIPGAAYLHMVEDLSAPRDGLPYNLPSTEHVTAVLRRIGVDTGMTLVLYGAGYPPAVTRCWWVLRASGVADVRILDGGWPRWIAEGRPVSTVEPEFPPGNITLTPNRDMVAGFTDVAAKLEDASALIINALTPEQHAGTGGAHYGRPGRIPGSVNVPTRQLYDPETLLYRPIEELRAQFAEAGAFDREHVIAYCGGGIAASTTAFILELLGHPRTALYDQSLLEWSNKPDLPMETG